MKEAEYYDFHLKNGPWIFEEVHCPLIKNTQILKAESTEIEENHSKFTVLLSRNLKSIKYYTDCS